MTDSSMNREREQRRGKIDIQGHQASMFRVDCGNQHVIGRPLHVLPGNRPYVMAGVDEDIAWSLADILIQFEFHGPPLFAPDALSWLTYA
jgi:hypothetical protein